MGKSLLGLVGWPIAHSASPAMMNQAFLHNGRDAVYVPFAVHPDRLYTALEGLAALGAYGVNVTIPHKMKAFDWVSSRTDAANLAGAVNTIRFDSKVGATGHNTDVLGWWMSIQSHLQTDLEEVTVLGAGGAAMAVVAALVLYRPSVRVSVIAREGHHRTHLQKQFSHHINLHIYDWELRLAVVDSSEFVVNTTPIGMWPNHTCSPIEPNVVFHKGQVVQDVVYRPLHTRFMDLAESRGATVVDGLSMLVSQGASAYEWWFGERAPKDVMSDVARQFVLNRQDA